MFSLSFTLFSAEEEIGFASYVPENARTLDRRRVVVASFGSSAAELHACPNLIKPQPQFYIYLACGERKRERKKKRERERERERERG